MTDDLKKLYKDNVVVEVFLTTSPRGHSRKARSLMADPTPAPVSAVCRGLSQAETCRVLMLQTQCAVFPSTATVCVEVYHRLNHVEC